MTSEFDCAPFSEIEKNFHETGGRSKFIKKLLKFLRQRRIKIHSNGFNENLALWH